MQAQAWTYTKRGRLSQTIEKGTVQVPEPEDGEIVVEIKAAALNPVDEQV